MTRADASEAFSDPPQTDILTPDDQLVIAEALLDPPPLGRELKDAIDRSVSMDLSVMCPVCNQPPGLACMGGDDGVREQPHYERHRAAVERAAGRETA